MPLHTPVQWISATLPKSGNLAGENEDAAAGAMGGIRFAIADGATEGWHSGPWARHLARSYVRRAPSPATFDHWLELIRGEWIPPSADGPVAWYAAEKEEQGSFATLLGIDLSPSKSTAGEWAWKAVAIGDSCLFQIRGDEVQTAFPLASADAFGTRPFLVPSSSGAKCPEPEWLAGRARSDDLLLLATDAAAARILDPSGWATALAAVRAALEALDRAPLLAWFRDVQQTVNDDITLTAIRLPVPAEVS